MVQSTNTVARANQTPSAAHTTPATTDATQTHNLQHVTPQQTPPEPVSSAATHNNMLTPAPDQRLHTITPTPIATLSTDANSAIPIAFAIPVSQTVHNDARALAAAFKTIDVSTILSWVKKHRGNEHQQRCGEIANSLVRQAKKNELSGKNEIALTGLDPTVDIDQLLDRLLCLMQCPPADRHQFNFAAHSNHLSWLFLAVHGKEAFGDIQTNQQQVLATAETGNIDRLKFYHHIYGAAVFELVDEDGNTCAHLAAANGHVDHLAFMQSVMGNTAFTSENNFAELPGHIVAKHGQIQCLEFIHHHIGQMVFANRDCDGRDFVHLAAQHGHVNCLEFIFANYCSNTSNHEYFARIFNCTDNDSCTPIHLAAQEDKSNTFAWLFEKLDESACHQRNDWGMTALELAGANCKSTFKSFFDDLEKINVTATTIRQWASGYEKDGNLYGRIANRLCENAVEDEIGLIKLPEYRAFTGLDTLVYCLNESSPSNFSIASHFFREDGSVETLTFYKALWGNNIFSQENNDGLTPAHIFVRGDSDAHQQCLQYLCANYPNAFAHKDREGNTPLEIAAQRGNLNAVTILLDALCPAQSKNKKSKADNPPIDLTKAIDLAKRGEHDLCVELLEDAKKTLENADKTRNNGSKNNNKSIASPQPDQAASITQSELANEDPLINRPSNTDNLAAKTDADESEANADYQSVTDSSEAIVDLSEANEDWSKADIHLLEEELLSRSPSPLSRTPSPADLLANRLEHTQLEAPADQASETTQPPNATLPANPTAEQPDSLTQPSTASAYNVPAHSAEQVAKNLSHYCELTFADRNQHVRATPVHLAAAFNDIPTLNYLLTAGMDFNARTNQGWSAVHFAADVGALDSLQFLQSIANADLNPVATDGQTTPAYLAVQNGHSDCLRFLLKMGVDPRQTFDGQETLLDIAIDFNQADCIEVLFEFGVDLSALRSNQFPPIFKAEQLGHKASADRIRTLLNLPSANLR